MRDIVGDLLLLTNPTLCAVMVGFGVAGGNWFSWSVAAFCALNHMTVLNVRANP